MTTDSLLRREFVLFVTYNCIFLLLQLSIVFLKSIDFIQAIALPISVYIEMVGTLVVHVLLYVILSAIQLFMLWGCLQRNPTVTLRARCHTLIWVVSAATLIFSNSYWFPSSVFSLSLISHKVLLGCLCCSWAILVSLLVMSLCYVCLRYPKRMTIMFIATIGFVFSLSIRSPLVESLSSKNPDIIIIGIDSLNPNVINEKDTPTLAHFIKGSVLFRETISPLARTYPAWTSILTGLYPHHHHANYNLMPGDTVKSSLSIAWSLKDMGYQTVFGSDDRRFNNIGKEFGFDRVIGPKVGINDFILGTYNDLLLSNLLVNHPVSRRLFPYNYLNRASSFSYYPESFDDDLQKALISNDHKTPLFLAVHFTLPHYPYRWAPVATYATNNRVLYKKAIKRADQEVATLLRTLDRAGYLENSTIILLSDHGEAFLEPGSRQTNKTAYQGQEPSRFGDYIKQKTDTLLNTSGGHGSDLLSPEQFRCLLAFKQYNHKQLITKPKIIETQVALIDIKPTLLEILQLPLKNSVDGISLLQSIMQANNQLPLRQFIMESGMLANQSLTPKRLKEVGHEFFVVNTKNNKLQLRVEKLSKLDALKLYAIIDDQWELAMYPNDKGFIPILLHRADGKWTDNLNNQFARQSPAKKMLAQLQAFYENRTDLHLR